MPNINKQGLSRRIPSDIKAQVRQRCGYGCVICGSIPYEYDHFNVAWTEAIQHDPEDIILLCQNHHGMKTRGMIDRDLIAQAIKVAPLDRPAHFKLPGTSPNFQIHWPANQIHAAQNAILIDGKEVFNLVYQENELEPVLLSGIFRGRDGAIICEIINNELISVPGGFGDFFAKASDLNSGITADEKRLSFRYRTRG